MDAVEFIKEFGRMCRSYPSCCEECPLYGEECAIVNHKDDPETLIKTVKKWSNKHPRKTRQDVFLKQWPNVKLGADGLVPIIPCALDTEYPRKKGYIDEDGCCTRASRGCAKCRREYWMQEVD